jgi:NAD(P)-dependent dehydrogenase (short-subunit alcohol dehydrogenase family)
MTRTLAGKTILVSGGSRGIGLAIALRAARDGTSIVLLAKTATPHPKLEGTIYTAAEQVEAAGGRAVPVVGDLRADEDVERAVGEAATAFGGIDAVVNNASAIDLSPTPKVSMKRYDLLQDVNARGTFALTRAALPYLEAAVRKARTPDIIADAAHAILTRDSRTGTGNFYTDEDVLRVEGVTDFSGYRLGDREEDLYLDFFLPDAPLPERP